MDGYKMCDLAVITYWSSTSRRCVQMGQNQEMFRPVPRPNVVKVYNEFMGGVDYLDRMYAKSRFHIRSKRWYMHIFWFTTKIAVANTWIIYRRKRLAMGDAKKDIA
ncbi:PiggyBac transposable element-derived protein 2 [Elysia marginata]|uniref:PiggyBac transposable element-derived protein 2 n=1 Tax=Elysia marginata TaxID=1093978 RepID=A0AAV4GBD6_9GAST|nr:PiggyBac transposable element-derived protein 2 [Elysia marginata]